MIIMGHSTRVENNNEVLLRVTNHTGMVRHSEKHLIIILHPSSLSHNNHLKILMYEDYCLDMEETRFCFEISNSPSTII